MEEDLIDFNLPENENSIITIIGVGGGGNNAVNRMHSQGIKDVDFFIANTDAQALAMSDVPLKIQLGETLTEGRGAGNRSDTGKKAAIESADKIRAAIKPSTKMAFIVAGMGGGTGTGATPVIAGICREMNILTVAVVTLPFKFEGDLRMKQAISGITYLKSQVDALLIINNEKLREIYGNLTLSNAFANADNVLNLAVRGIAEIITLHGYVNVDFADVKSVLSNGGISFMGSASASGDSRATEVIENTINSPLLNSNDIKGASKVLLNITSGTEEITVDEIGIITEKIIKSVQGKVNTIWGTCTDESLGEEIRITLIATGFSEDSIPEFIEQNPPEKEKIELEPSKDNILFPEIEKEQKADDVRVEETTVKKVLKKPEKDKPSKGSSDLFDNLDFSVNNKAPIIEEELIDDGLQESKIDIKPPQKPEVDLDEVELNSLERIKTARLKALNYNNFYDSGDIDKIEKIPAYKRKKDPVQSEMFPKEEEESDLVLDKMGTLMSANNKHLYDNVD